jgi:E3 ubiquitin-protein ligase DOA10
VGVGLDEPTRNLIDRISLGFKYNIALDEALDMAKITTLIIVPFYVIPLDFIVFPFVTGRLIGLFSSSYSTRTRWMRCCYWCYIGVRLAESLARLAVRRLVKYLAKVRDNIYEVETELTNRS